MHIPQCWLLSNCPFSVGNVTIMCTRQPCHLFQRTAAKASGSNSTASISATLSLLVLTVSWVASSNCCPPPPPLFLPAHDLTISLNLADKAAVNTCERL